MDGDESDGLDECPFLAVPLWCIPVMNRTLLGICAMDYLGDDPYPNSDTPGLIVDDVSYLE
jgi:hypothetical protein